MFLKLHDLRYETFHKGTSKIYFLLPNGNNHVIIIQNLHETSFAWKQFQTKIQKPLGNFLA